MIRFYYVYVRSLLSLVHRVHIIHRTSNCILLLLGTLRTQVVRFRVVGSSMVRAWKIALIKQSIHSHLLFGHGINHRHPLPKGDPIEIYLRVPGLAMSAMGCALVILDELERRTLTDYKQELRSYYLFDLGEVSVARSPGLYEIRAYFELC